MIYASCRSLVMALLFASASMHHVYAATPADFTLKSAKGDKSFTLSKAKGKMVALHFLLKTECPLCLKHTRDYATRASAALPGAEQVFIKPDTDEEINKWAATLPTTGSLAVTIYRDPDAQLAKQFAIPDGYQFHGQSVHFPALVLLNEKGEEVFRYVGKSNRDRFTVEQLQAKLAELSKQ